MDQGIAALIVGVMTVTASGITSSIVTFRLSRTKEQELFMRAKAEQLYLSTDEYGKTLAGVVVQHIPLLEGRIDYNQMLDMQIADGSKERKYGGAETMTMLVEIYFPSARDALARVWKARDAFSAVTGEIKQHYKHFGEATDPELKARFFAVARAIDEEIKVLQAEVVHAARRHAGERVRNGRMRPASDADPA